MIDVARLKIGDKVHYQPDHCHDYGYDNGIVKEIPHATNRSARVVYKCDSNRDNFRNYTGELTRVNELKPGWRHD